ncbi:MAG TPA: hypothetical protein VIM73_21845, partial [Polyangiaceae bacterium]
LERRGVLSPEEITRLASKTRRATGAAGGHKAGCHSDVADSVSARQFQEQKLVQLRVGPTGDAAE